MVDVGAVKVIVCVDLAVGVVQVLPPKSHLSRLHPGTVGAEDRNSLGLESLDMVGIENRVTV